MSSVSPVMLITGYQSRHRAATARLAAQQVMPWRLIIRTINPWRQRLQAELLQQGARVALFCAGASVRRRRDTALVLRIVMANSGAFR